MIAVYRSPFKICVAVNLKRQQLRVFCLWDIENIPIPRGPSAYSVACAIHQELASLAMSSRGTTSTVIPHSDFSVFHNPRGSHSLSRKVCKELTRAAVKLVDIGYTCSAGVPVWYSSFLMEYLVYFSTDWIKRRWLIKLLNENVRGSFIPIEMIVMVPSFSKNDLFAFCCQTLAHFPSCK
jgi:hypothetical protein